MNPKVYILVLNWNGWRDTIECLESVFRLNYDNYQVIVCDNQSQDNSFQQIMNWANGLNEVNIQKSDPMYAFSYPPVSKPISYVTYDRSSAESGGNLNHSDSTDKPPLILIQTGDNLGFAGGNNVGLRYIMTQADSQYVWLLNNDTVVEKNSLLNMVSYSSRKPFKNICGSKLIFYEDPQYVQAYAGAKYNKWTGNAKSLGMLNNTSQPVDVSKIENELSYIMGASWLLPVSFLHEIGLMEDAYFLYYEEIDWCIRGQESYQLCYADNAIVYHKEGKSIGSSSDKTKTSLFSDFYLFKNKLVFTKKFYPKALIPVYFTTFLQALNRVRRNQLDKAKLIIQILFGKRQY